MTRPRLPLLAAMAFSLLFCSHGALARGAENEGQADLDKALELRLTAQSVQELSQVIDLAQSALNKGLDEENRPFAEKLLAGALLQRGQSYGAPIFREGGPVSQWQELSQLATSDLQRAVELDDSLLEAHLLLGKLYALPGGDREKAQAELSKVQKAEGVDLRKVAEALTLRAGLTQQADQQLELLNEAVELGVDYAPAFRTRGMLHLKSRRVEPAIADLKKALELDPDHGPTHQALGMAYITQEQFNEAESRFDRAIELQPQRMSGYLNRARARTLQAKFRQALDDLNKAHQLEPESLDALMLRARVHVQLGQVEQALADCQRALSIRRLWPIERLKAEVLVAAGRIDEAIEFLEASGRRDAENLELRMQLGLYYLVDNRPRQAITALNEVLQGDQDNWRALRSRGDAYLAIGKQAAAIDDYNRALKLQPEHSGLLNNLAWVLATSPDEKLRDGPRALKLAQKACELTEYQEGYILSTLAAAHAEVGDFESARKWSKQAVELGEGEQLDQLKQELASYEAEKPWRELQSAGKEPAAEPADKPDDSAPARTLEF